MKSSLARVAAVVVLLAAVTVLAGPSSRAAQPGTGVEFYLLQDDKMDFEKARAKPLADLALRSQPWVAAADIERYDWSTHCVCLKKPVAVPLAPGQKHVLLRGTPLVVVADGQRCYLAALWSPASSFLPEGSVAIIDLWGSRVERIDISLHGFLRPGETATDVRADPRVMKALQGRGQFHAGLECLLDKVRVERKGDASTVVYTYTLRNLDDDNLYVIDPQRIEPAFFHDFQNGVSGVDVDDGTVFRWPNPRQGGPQAAPWGKADAGWFSQLNKGEQMTRTVAMDPMPRIFAGKYRCQFSFGSGGYSQLRNEQLVRSDGRLWLGRITTPGVEVTVK